MLLEIHPQNPQERLIDQVVECLKSGGIIIYPTDTIYGMGCDLHNAAAVEKLCKIRGINPKKLNLSFICCDLSHISEYTHQIDNNVFRLLKRGTPGAYTFILKASTKVPKIMGLAKKTVGIRVPDSKIIHLIVEKLGRPIVNTSVHSEDEIRQYLTDPEEIQEKFGKLVDIIIDGGIGGNEHSTVIECTDNDIYIVREGKGDISII